MYLSKRTVILFRELAKSKVALTSRYLSQVVGVTSRTVKKDLQQLGEMLLEYGANLISKPGSGYQLYIVDEMKYHHFLKLMDHSELVDDQIIPRYAYERVNYIIKKLLMIDYYIKFEDFMDELHVGRSTITNDMKTVRENLQKYGLTLTHKPAKGTIIAGKESAKRQCIAEYFFHNAVGERFYVKDNIMFHSLQNQTELAHLRNELVTILVQYHIHLSDISIEYLMIHIAVMMRRLTFSNYIEVSVEQHELQNTPEYEASKQYCKVLEEMLDMDIPESEVIYVTMHLISKHINEQMSLSQDEQNHLSDVILQGLKTIQDQYDINLCIDQELQDLLMLHLEPMIRRIRMGMVMRNPLAYTTTIRYLYAAQIATAFCTEIEKQYQIHVDFNEFGYLVLYFNMAIDRNRNAEVKKIALICGRGRPEMITILSQMKEVLARYHVSFSMLDTFQIQNIDLSQFYFIISTVPLDLPDDTPVIVIHAFDETEMNLVKRTYQSMQFKNIPIHRIFAYSDIFSLHKETMNTALVEFSQRMKLNVNPVDLKHDLLCIAKNNIAVLHHQVLDQPTGLMIGILEKPIEKDHKIIQMIIMVKCHRDDVMHLSGILYILSKWIRNEEAVNRFMKRKQLDYLQEQFNQIMASS